MRVRVRVSALTASRPFGAAPLAVKMPVSLSTPYRPRLIQKAP